MTKNKQQNKKRAKLRKKYPRRFVQRLGTELAQRDGGWYCYYCGDEVHPDPDRVDSLHKPKQATIDHKTPLSRGGADSKRNTVIACKDCNDEKSDSDFTMFYQKKKSERLDKSGQQKEVS